MYKSPVWFATNFLILSAFTLRKICQNTSFFQRKSVFCHILRRVRSLTDPVYRFYETELILNINIDLILQCKPHSLQNQTSIEEGLSDLHQRILIVTKQQPNKATYRNFLTFLFWYFFSFCTENYLFYQFEHTYPNCFKNYF